MMDCIEKFIRFTATLAIIVSFADCSYALENPVIIIISIIVFIDTVRIFIKWIKENQKEEI